MLHFFSGFQYGVSPAAFLRAITRILHYSAPPNTKCPKNDQHVNKNNYDL